MSREGTSTNGSSDRVLPTLRAMRTWSRVAGVEVHGCFLGKVQFELGIERYIAIRHLGFWADEGDEQRYRSCVTR